MFQINKRSILSEIRIFRKIMRMFLKIIRINKQEMRICV